MPEPYAWDCTNPHCRRRNAAKLAHCHFCRWPRETGQLLCHASQAETPGWWLLLLVVPALFFIPWPITFGIAFFGLLCWIGVGIWRLVDQKERR